MKLNIFSILEQAAGAASVLSLAGVEVPPALTRVLGSAAQVAAVVATGTQVTAVSGVQSPIVSDLLEAGAAVTATTGNTAADAAITNLLGQIAPYASEVSAYKAGQPVILAKTVVSIGGVAHTSYTIEALDSSEIVKGLGL